jgi:hypothetical protein
MCSIALLMLRTSHRDGTINQIRADRAAPASIRAAFSAALFKLFWLKSGDIRKASIKKYADLHALTVL